MTFETITAIRTQRSEHPKIHRVGNMHPATLDQALDSVKREIGTHDYTPFDRFIEEHLLNPVTWQNPDSSYHVSLNASYKHHSYDHSLHIAAADGPTPAAARRNLAAKITGKILVFGSPMPSAKRLEVPDLHDQNDPHNQKDIRQAFRELLDRFDSETIEEMRAALRMAPASPDA